jgi:hypothetical protein
MAESNCEDHAAMSARHLSEAGDRIKRQRDWIDQLRKRAPAHDLLAWDGNAGEIH